jgi:hypothetical protein
MIWQEVCDLPHAINVVWHLSPNLSMPRQDLTREQIEQFPLVCDSGLCQTIPSVLNVCFEARKVALQKYDVFYSVRGGTQQDDLPVHDDNRKRMYINYSAATLVCPDWQTPLLIFPRTRGPEDNSALDFVRYMVIGNPDINEVICLFPYLMEKFHSGIRITSRVVLFSAGVECGVIDRAEFFI